MKTSHQYLGFLMTLLLMASSGCDNGGGSSDIKTDGTEKGGMKDQKSHGDSGQESATGNESTTGEQVASSGSSLSGESKDAPRGAATGNATPESVNAAGKPTPAPSGVSKAKIAKVDQSKNGAGKYTMETTFTSGQGREFVVNVLSDGTGAVLFSEPVKSIPDYYYSHTTTFSYAGALADLTVQVLSAEDRQILDTWDL